MLPKEHIYLKYALQRAGEVPHLLSKEQVRFHTCSPKSR
jgi:hypothetical protein